MKTVKVNIPHMKTTHCELTVTAAVKNIGATTRSIAPTEAEIELGNGVTQDAVIHAIENAGYKVGASLMSKKIIRWKPRNIELISSALVVSTR